MEFMELSFQESPSPQHSMPKQQLNLQEDLSLYCLKGRDITFQDLCSTPQSVHLLRYKGTSLIPVIISAI